MDVGSGDCSVEPFDGSSTEVGSGSFPREPDPDPLPSSTGVGWVAAPVGWGTGVLGVEHSPHPWSIGVGVDPTFSVGVASGVLGVAQHGVAEGSVPGVSVGPGVSVTRPQFWQGVTVGPPGVTEGPGTDVIAGGVNVG